MFSCEVQKILIQQVEHWLHFNSSFALGWPLVQPKTRINRVTLRLVYTKPLGLNCLVYSYLICSSQSQIGFSNPTAYFKVLETFTRWVGMELRYKSWIIPLSVEYSHYYSLGDSCLYFPSSSLVFFLSPPLQETYCV